MISEATPLGDRMRKLAETHERSDELREKAEAFEAAANGYYADEPTHTVKQFLGAFARARICWSQCSGEPLV